MSLLEQHIKSVQQKLHLLAKKYMQLQKENLQLKQELLQLKQKHTDSKQELDVVEMQNAMLKASQQQLGDKEKKELEKNLQHFITEIDRSISMLSR